MPCSLCARSDVEQINSALDAGRSYREIEQQFDVSHGSLSRHNQHRLTGTDEPDDAVSTLLTSIRDAIDQDYTDKLTTAQQQLHERQAGLAQAFAAVQEARRQVDAGALAVAVARINAPYPPFKRPNDPRTPRRDFAHYQLHPLWDVVEVAEIAHRQQAETYAGAYQTWAALDGQVRWSQRQIQDLTAERTAHLERLTKPETAHLAGELVQYSLALETAIQQHQPQDLVDHLQREVDRRHHKLRTGRTSTPA